MAYSGGLRKAYRTKAEKLRAIEARLKQTRSFEGAVALKQLWIQTKTKGEK